MIMNGKQFIEKISTRRNAYQGTGRIEKINQVAKTHGVSIEDVTVVINRDPTWNTRSNRTTAEKKAVKIGQTNDKLKGYPEEVIWAFVK
jgi:pyrroloquinoline quinone (PQQ) biosynthesis protein C